MPKLKTKRICSEGHAFYKSSDCPVCPVCEKARPSFLQGLGAPARRALESAGISSLKHFEAWTEYDLLKLHGLGPSAIPKIKQELKQAGLRLKPKD